MSSNNRRVWLVSFLAFGFIISLALDIVFSGDWAFGGSASSIIVPFLGFLLGGILATFVTWYLARRG